MVRRGAYDIILKACLLALFQDADLPPRLILTAYIYLWAKLPDFTLDSMQNHWISTYPHFLQLDPAKPGK
jgi:hypothetical protein